MLQWRKGRISPFPDRRYFLVRWRGGLVAIFLLSFLYFLLLSFAFVVLVYVIVRRCIYVILFSINGYVLILQVCDWVSCKMMWSNISPLVLGLALDRDCLILLFQRGVLLLLAGDGDSLDSAIPRIRPSPRKPQGKIKSFLSSLEHLPSSPHLLYASSSSSKNESSR